jgi:hypothetical protein
MQTAEFSKNSFILCSGIYFLYLHIFCLQLCMVLSNSSIRFKTPFKTRKAWSFYTHRVVREPDIPSSLWTPHKPHSGFQGEKRKWLIEHFPLHHDHSCAMGTWTGQTTSQEVCTPGKRVGLSAGEGSPESLNQFFFYPILWVEVWETAHFSASLSESNRS